MSYAPGMVKYIDTLISYWIGWNLPLRSLSWPALYLLPVNGLSDEHAQVVCRRTGLGSDARQSLFLNGFETMVMHRGKIQEIKAK